MLTRALSGLVFLIVVISATMYSSWTMGLLFLIFTVIGLLEFYALNKNSNAQIFLGVLLGIATYCILFLHALGEVDTSAFLYLIPVVSLIYLVELYRDKEHTLENLATTIWGVIYVAVPFALLGHLSHMSGSYSYYLPLGILLIIWSSDTFAYLTGSLLGKTKLFEKISPKKSWEGYFGGLVFAVVTGYLVFLLFESESLTHWIVIATIIGTVGALGDLIESKMKRSAGVKDSGNIMPGHGGILDRFDSLLFVVPLVYFYLKIWAA